MASFIKPRRSTQPTLDLIVEEDTIELLQPERIPSRQRLRAPGLGWVRRLTFLNLLALAVHVVSASLGTVLIQHGNPMVSAIAPLFEYNTVAGAGFFEPRPQTIFRIGSLTSLVLFEWITAFFHVVYLLQIHSPFFRELLFSITGGGGTNPVRWIEYAITAGIMAAFANLNIGITDFYLFLKVLTSNIALQMVGFVLEIMDSSDNLHRRIGNILWNQATMLNLVNVFILLFQIFKSDLHTSRFYYNVIPYSVLFQTFGIVAWQNFDRAGFFASPDYAEAWYIGLSLGTKFAVFWLGFSTYRGIEEERGFAQKVADVDWDAVRYTSSYLPAGLMLAVALYEYMRWQRVKRDR